ncbi:hypothetical protein BC567DRAFT_98040 [Phyllosticta citribraziliensis]
MFAAIKYDCSAMSSIHDRISGGYECHHVDGPSMHSSATALLVPRDLFPFPLPTTFGFQQAPCSNLAPTPTRSQPNLAKFISPNSPCLLLMTTFQDQNKTTRARILSACTVTQHGLHTSSERTSNCTPTQGNSPAGVFLAASPTPHPQSIQPFINAIHPRESSPSLTVFCRGGPSA